MLPPHILARAITVRIAMQTLDRSTARSAILLLCLILAASTACTAGAFEDILARRGQEGVTITSLAMDPRSHSTLYAGTYFGVFKSVDGGENWIGVNSGLPDAEVWSLAIDPLTPATVYAAIEGGSVFKSTNGGRGWSESSTGLMTNAIHVLAIEPTMPTTLYAGTSPIEHGPVFKSTNGGETWIMSGTGLEHHSVHALVIDPEAPGTLYAGTSGGVFKSVDGAVSWTRIHVGAGVEIAGLAIDPAMPTILYAGGRGGPFYRTPDGGETWTAHSGNGYLYTLAITQQAPSILYAGTPGWMGGVLKSADGGASWTVVNTGLPDADIFALAIDPENPATLYAGTHYEGVFKSTDAGDSWSATNTGLTADASTP